MNNFLTKENGNSSELSKSEDTSSKELNKERDLKDLETELKSLKSKLQDIKIKSIVSEFLTAKILLGELLILAFSHNTTNFHTLLIPMSIFYVATKSFSLLTLGSRIPRHGKKKKLTTAISNLEKVMLETKEENKAKTNNISNDNTKSYNNILNYQSSDKYILKKECKKRVLKK